MDDPAAHCDVHTTCLPLFLCDNVQVRSKVEARGINFLSVGDWTEEEAKEYARSVK